jgi:hypothetical protein
LELRGQHFRAVVFAQKRIAHAFDDVAHRREVDGDFVGETIVRGRRPVGLLQRADRTISKRITIHK